MTPNELMNKIGEEADKQTIFYKQISDMAETKNKLKCIEMLIEKFNCDFDSARIVMDFVIDGTPLPSTLSEAEIIRANAEAREALNKPKCITCGSANIVKISATSKVVNVAMFGLFGNKRKKTFHCKNCGYEW